MTILRDVDLKVLAVEGRAIVNPFLDQSVRNGVISYGLSHTGYDIRVGSKFSLFRNMPVDRFDHPDEEVDPKNFRGDNIVFDVTVPPGEVLRMAPLSYALGHSVEYFDMPLDTVGVAVGKSTYARCGIIINVTPLEPGWKGHLTIEIFNATKRHVKVYPNEGICQILFFRAAGNVGVSYESKGGKYQHQTANPVFPITEQWNQGQAGELQGVHQPPRLFSNLGSVLL